MNLEELFSAGAHRTAEFLLQTRRATTSVAALQFALEGRFGVGQVSMADAGRIYREANAAIRAGQLIETGTSITPDYYGINPSLTARYSYTTVSSLPDPRRAGHRVEIPYTVYSDVELTPNEIREQAQAAVLDPGFTRDCVPGALGADLLRRDVDFKDSAQINAPAIEIIDTQIASAYRRS